MTIDEAITDEEQKKKNQMTQEEALIMLKNGLLPQVHGRYHEALRMVIDCYDFEWMHKRNDKQERRNK